MAFGQNPGLKRKTRRIGAERHEIVVLRGYAHLGLQLLPDNVAEDAALFTAEVALGAIQFLNYLLGQNRQSDDLRMRVLQARACSFAMVLEYQDVLETAVLLQVENAVTEGP